VQRNDSERSDDFCVDGFVEYLSTKTHLSTTFCDEIDFAAVLQKV